MNLTTKELLDALNVHLASMAPEWRVYWITDTDVGPCGIRATHESYAKERTFFVTPERLRSAQTDPGILYQLACAIAPVLTKTTSVAPKPKPSLCGCGKHEINPKGDVYAQHREWSGDDIEAKEATRTGMYAARGIGISAPEPDPLVVQDPTGDDVAPDAFTTTGGKTLDDIIDEARAGGHTGPKGTFVRGDGAAFSAPPACSSPADTHRDALIWSDEEEMLRDMMVSHIIIRGKR